ncbi:hypothetical protein ACMDCT_07670 [Halomonadaceae bacterium KBTZ08]
MNKLFRATTMTLATAAMAGNALAQAQEYNEPTRGFMLERGTTAANKRATVDLRSGGDQDFGAGVRLGLPNAELVLNHSRVNPRTRQNEALFKVGLRPLQAGEGVTVNWAAYGAVAHYDGDDANPPAYPDESTTNLGAGAAFTTNVERFTLNFNPELIYDDGARNDASNAYLNLGMGAHYALPETEFGRFEPGIEVGLTTREDRFGDSVDPSLMLGARWLYNQNVTLDVSMIQARPNNGLAEAPTEVSIPGYIRVNVAF